MKKKVKFLSIVLSSIFLICALTFIAYMVDVSTFSGLQQAFIDLQSSGGTIYLTADITLDANTVFAANTPRITVDGNNHTITLSGNVTFQGDVTLKRVTLNSNTSAPVIYCNGNDVIFESTVSCSQTGTYKYPSIMGGYSTATAFTGGHVTINGGTWYRIRGGNQSTGTAVQSSTLTIGGGTFKDYVTVGGAGSMSSGSQVTADISGGTFENGIYCFTPGSGSVNANAALTIDGGTVKNYIKVYHESGFTGSLAGNCTLNINEGDFVDCKGILDEGDNTNMNVSCVFSNEARFETALGTYYESVVSGDEVEVLSNTKIRESVADPWVFTDNGYYYMTVSGTTQLKLYKSRTIEGLATATSKTIFAWDDDLCENLHMLLPEDEYGNGICAGTWSPEIHYFSESDFPSHPEYSGWYLYFAINRGVNSVYGSVDVRMVVMKSLTGTPDGPYGNPQTGTEGQPIRITYNGSNITSWTCGMSILKVPSSSAYEGCYAMWVTETGRSTWATTSYSNPTFYQMIKIAELNSPWNVTTSGTTIITPTQGWEKDSARTQYKPAVVEGATAVYGSGGQIYISYSGGGYWTDYGIGQVTWNGGNPLSSGSWVKYAYNPMFSCNDAGGTHYSDVPLQGAGHGSFVKDDDGQMYFIYHAYPYNTTTQEKGDHRNAYIEPCYINYSLGLIKYGINDNKKPADPATSQNILCFNEGIVKPWAMVIECPTAAPAVTPVVTSVLHLNGTTTIEWESTGEPLGPTHYYQVFCWKASEFPGTYTCYASYSNSYEYSNLLSGTDYIFSIRSKYYCGTTAYYSSNNGTVDLSIPSKETVSLTNTPSGVQITCSADSHANSYKFYRSDTLDGTYVQIAKVTTTSYVDTTAVSGNVYYYKTRACWQGGVAIGYGEQSDPASITCQR